MDSARNVARCRAPDGMDPLLPFEPCTVLPATLGGRGLGSGLCAGHPRVCPCRDWCMVLRPPLVPCLQDSQQGGLV